MVRRRRPFVYVVALFATVVMIGCSHRPSPGRAPAGDVPPPFHFSAARAQRGLDALVSHYHAGGGVVAVSVAGGAPTIITTGVAPGTGTHFTGESRLLIASLSKLFIGALTLRLADEHRLDLDRTLAAYGIDWPDADRITLRMLLTHTSGIPPLGGDLGRPDQNEAAFTSLVTRDPTHRFTIDEILDFARHRPNRFAPGTSTSYTNLDTILAAKIDELVTGEPIARLLHDRVADRLHLANTTYAPDEKPGADVVNPEPNVDGTAFLTAIGPAGAMVSDATDLIVFANAFLRDRTLVSPDGEAQATTISLGGTGAGTLGFGGFHRHDSFCVFLTTGCRPGTVFSGIGGSGSIPGVSTILVYDKTSDSTVLVYVLGTGVPTEFLAHAVWFGQELQF